MPLVLYLDVHVQKSITTALRLRGVDVLTAQQDGTLTLSDYELLDRATHLGRVIFTRDDDFLTEAARRQESGIPFAGVIYAHQLRVSIRTCIDDLDLLAKACDPPDLANRWSTCLFDNSPNAYLSRYRTEPKNDSYEGANGCFPTYPQKRQKSEQE